MALGRRQGQERVVATQGGEPRAGLADGLDERLEAVEPDGPAEEGGRDLERRRIGGAVAQPSETDQQRPRTGGVGKVSLEGSKELVDDRRFDQ